MSGHRVLLIVCGVAAFLGVIGAVAQHYAALRTCASVAHRAQAEAWKLDSADRCVVLIVMRAPDGWHGTFEIVLEADGGNVRGIGAINSVRAMVEAGLL